MDFTLPLKLTRPYPYGPCSRASTLFIFLLLPSLRDLFLLYVCVAIRRDEYDGKSEPLKGSFLLRTYSRTDTGHYLARHRANLRVARLFLYLCLNCFFFCYEFVQVNVSVFIHRERLWSNFPTSNYLCFCFSDRRIFAMSSYLPSTSLKKPSDQARNSSRAEDTCCEFFSSTLKDLRSNLLL